MNKIILLSLSILLLTGCTAQIEELKKKVRVRKTTETEEGIIKETEEGLKDPSEMSLEEMEEELEEMEDPEIEEDLKEINKELE